LNADEYWNGTDPWEWNVIGGVGCYYWGDGDGDGIVAPGDLSMMENLVMGLPADFSNVYPPNGQTLELDGDGIAGPGDLSLMESMVMGLPVLEILSRPTSLEVVESPGASVDVGATTHVTVSVMNGGDIQYSPGHGVIFELLPASTGAAILFGGEGSDSPGNRYDLSGPIEDQGRTHIVLRIVSAGTLYLNARIPECGMESSGRYCPELNLAEPVEIIGR